MSDGGRLTDVLTCCANAVATPLSSGLAFFGGVHPTPTPFELASDVDRVGLSHGGLPYCRREHNLVSQPSAAKPIPTVL